MTREQALSALSLQDPVSPPIIRAAFRAACARRTAPRPDDVVESFYTIDALRDACDLLSNSTPTIFRACVACKGRGRVQMGFEPQTCVVCGGTGEQR